MAKPSIQPQPPLWSLASTPALSMPTLLEPHPGTTPSWAPISTSSQKVNPSPSATPSPPPIQNKPPPPQRSPSPSRAPTTLPPSPPIEPTTVSRTRRCLRSKPGPATPAPSSSTTSTPPTPSRSPFAPNNDITWVNPDGETIDPATAAALVAGFNTGVIDAGRSWNHTLELLRPGRRSRLPRRR